MATAEVLRGARDLDGLSGLWRAGEVEESIGIQRYRVFAIQRRRSKSEIKKWFRQREVVISALVRDAECRCTGHELVKLVYQPTTRFIH